MTGLRLGYACAPPELTEAMMKIHQYSMLCAPIMSQRRPSRPWRMARRRSRRCARATSSGGIWSVARLNAMGLPTFKPGGAFYVFADIRPTGLTSKEFAIGSGQEQSVAVVPGSAFGQRAKGLCGACYATALPKLESRAGADGQFVAGLRTTAVKAA